MCDFCEREDLIMSMEVDFIGEGGYISTDTIGVFIDTRQGGYTMCFSLQNLKIEHDNIKKRMLNILQDYYYMDNDDYEYLVDLMLEYKDIGEKIYLLEKENPNCKRWHMIKIYAGTEDEQSFVIYSTLSSVKNSIESYLQNKENNMYLEHYLKLMYFCIDAYDDEVMEKYGLLFKFDVSNDADYDLIY